jgi:hypothetical protein
MDWDQAVGYTPTQTTQAPQGIPSVTLCLDVATKAVVEAKPEDVKAAQTYALIRDQQGAVFTLSQYSPLSELNADARSRPHGTAASRPRLLRDRIGVMPTVMVDIANSA